MKLIDRQLRSAGMGAIFPKLGLLLAIIAVLGTAGCAAASPQTDNPSPLTAIPAEELESTSSDEPALDALDSNSPDPAAGKQEGAELSAPQPTPIENPSDPESEPASAQQPGLAGGTLPSTIPQAADLLPDPGPTLIPAPDESSLEVGTKVGHLAPDFTLQTLDGGEISLADLRGHPILLNYWATWCPPCLEELGYFEALQQEYASQGFQVIAINGIEQDKLDNVHSTVSETGISFPVLLDYDENIWQNYQIMFMPTTYFIDESGVIRAVQLGSASEADFREKVTRLIAGQL